MATNEVTDEQILHAFSDALYADPNSLKVYSSAANRFDVALENPIEWYLSFQVCAFMVYNSLSIDGFGLKLAQRIGAHLKSEAVQ